ncbi:ATP-dependent DNA helicase PIF1 [Trifolium medium]|uniref:ATP-dependent DNA helicase n=1 Tax=Trifolium medium TaxID=97028 RepID=A0A392LX22_9FABA|nr:ATP-dependent DNA helicase PIF1 [Trifolium medium]
MKGNITLPQLIEPPVLIRNLFAGLDPRSSNFMLNLRSYNNMFSFTSFGGKIVSNKNKGSGPPNFVIAGQNYHRIGSLIPDEGQRPKFAQLYIYDTENEVDNRLSHFSEHSGSNRLDPSLVEDLLKVMDEHNILVKSFRMVRDFYRGNQNVHVKLRLFRGRTFDPRTYNVPGIDEVAALIVGDLDSSENGRDIIVRERDGYLQKIHETHAKYIPLQYPLLFPFGEDQYDETLRRNILTVTGTVKKRVRVTLREFIAYRLQERVLENSILLHGRRLFQQFVVDLYSMIESQRLSYIRYNQTKIRADFLAGVEEAVGRGDFVGSSVGSRVVLPSSFTGGRRYMFNNCQDSMALCKKFGYPDLFLTVTCNPKWDEIHRHLSKSRNYAPYRPDISCRVFHVKLKEMMKDFKKGHFFGRLVASVYTIEFQKRGLPHAHILLWLDKRDRLDSPASIDSVICAEIPDESFFPKLYSAVSRFMIHGPCRVGQQFSPCDDDIVDEIKQFYDCRYLSPSESIWRIFKFDIHSRWPAVQRLTFHLRSEQRILFKDGSNLQSVLSRNRDRNTMFLAWFEANRRYSAGRCLTYIQFPSKFVYDSDNRRWYPRKQGESIGRLSFIPPSNRELYYMRLLLNVQVGCKSFEDIRTVDNHVYDTYREACGELQLLADDREFIDAIDELSILGSGYYLRKVFAVLLLASSMSDPLKVWLLKWEILADGILYSRRRTLNNPDLVISSEDLKQLCLIEIDKILRPNGKCLADYKCMPKIHAGGVETTNNLLIDNELSYDRGEMLLKHDDLFRSLNDEQLSAYHQIVDAVTNSLGGMFFVDGFGGSGKTYLWNALSFRFRSEGKIVLNVASSGIASLLLPGGRTAHSLFGIPLVLTEESCCKIDKQGDKAKLLVRTSLIIWDEAPMINRLAFEAFDKTLRDIMNKVVKGASKVPFGGKTIVFGGDFRQILPVVPKGGRADIVHATINSSPLWRFCRVLKLTKNMRIQFSTDTEENKSLVEFAKWILDVGDGKLGVSDDGEANIEILEDLCVKSTGNHIHDIVNATYPDLIEHMGDPKFFQDRAILAPTLELVEKVNDYVMSLLSFEEKEYLSCDTVCRCDEDVGIDERWITTEFLNDIKCSGMPNHKLRLKVGVPVMLLRNTDVSSGLCNGTRLTVVELGKKIIGAVIVNGPHSGEKVFIPRMSLMPSDSNVSISFQRRQFPLCLCFAMTINKSQGQTLSDVGLYLPRPVFTHGQLILGSYAV